ncbi:MAG: bacteriohemerythrin [Xanthomonadales bacterium]|jgi:hemerythrin|nr:bacteriohemerythrin [Xanthomonadales bacterium]
MRHFEWRDDLNTGISVIDHQHQKIVRYINTLIDSQHNEKIVFAVIEELTEYTVSHFAYEEALMEQANYPFLAPHKKVHDLFISRVNQYVERFKQGEDVTDELIVMLKRWLVSHIQNEDADYVESVQAVQEKMHYSVKQSMMSKLWHKLF